MGKPFQTKNIDTSSSKRESIMDWDKTAQNENQYQDSTQAQGSSAQVHLCSKDLDKTSNSLFDTTSKSDLIINEPEPKRIHYIKKEQEEEGENMDEVQNFLNLSPEDLDVAQQMLGNHLILSKILGHLPSKELLKFREINKLWEEESTRLALKRNSIYIYFRFDMDSRLHTVPYKPATLPNSDHNYSSNFTLDKLNDLLETSRCFPVGYFLFNGGDLCSKTVQDFLEIHGNEIRNLDLNMKMTSSSLKNLLLNQAPRIQRLVLKRIPDEWKSDEKSPFLPQKTVLPHLKSIYFDNNCPLILELIDAAPHLLNIDGDLVQLLKNPIILQRSQLIKNLVLDVDPQTINLELLAKEKPQLEQLTLVSFSKSLTPLSKSKSNHSESHFSNALSKILESSSSSLNVMEISLDPEYFARILWPKLENLQYLSVRQSRSSQSFQLDPLFLSEVVPNLLSLSLHFSRQGPTFVLSRFLSLKPQSKMIHLKKVSLKYALPEILRKLLIIAPNLEELAARFIPNLPSVKNYIWGFKQLKKMELGILVAPLILNNLFPHIDVAFTGLSEKIIFDLQDPNYFDQMKGKEISRDGLSILDCKDLQILQIRVIAARLNVVEIYVPSPNRKLSWVIGEFGFKKLPNLNVEILVEAGTEFDVNQLSPYAKISMASPSE